MDFNDPHQRHVFFEIHSGLPREGPGDRASTARALATAQAVSSCDQVLDIGCGPGQQTIDLANLLTAAQIAAVDLHRPFLTELNRRSSAAAFGQRISAVCADMARLPFADNQFDLIWCEGAAYFLGLPRALNDWKRLLQTNGVIALTEAGWLQPNPPEELRQVWAEEYPAMTDVAGCRRIIAKQGYRLLDDFVLPDQAWLTDYYDPMAVRVEQLAPKYADDPNATAVLNEARAEIDMFQRYSSFYGYVFLIVTPSKS